MSKSTVELLAIVLAKKTPETIEDREAFLIRLFGGNEDLLVHAPDVKNPNIFAVKVIREYMIPNFVIGTKETRTEFLLRLEKVLNGEIKIQLSKEEKQEILKNRLLGLELVKLMAPYGNGHFMGPQRKIIRKGIAPFFITSDRKRYEIIKSIFGKHASEVWGQLPQESSAVNFTDKLIDTLSSRGLNAYLENIAIYFSTHL